MKKNTFNSKRMTRILLFMSVLVMVLQSSCASLSFLFSFLHFGFLSLSLSSWMCGVFVSNHALFCRGGILLGSLPSSSVHLTQSSPLVCHRLISWLLLILTANLQFSPERKTILRWRDELMFFWCCNTSWKTSWSSRVKNVSFTLTQFPT